MKFSKKYSCTLIFPEDVAVGKKMDGESIIKELNDQKIDYLEIGSFEGRSAVFVSELNVFLISETRRVLSEKSSLT